VGKERNGLEFEKPILELQQQIDALEDATSERELQQLAELKRNAEKLRREIYSKLSPWERVQVARHPDRPQTLDYIKMCFDNFMELHGDRAFSDDRAIVCGFARLDGRRVMVIGHQKGKSTRERVTHYFGCAHPEGYRKAMRCMKLAERYGVPIVTLIDTPGAYPGVGAEERGQFQAIAINQEEMSRLKVPVVCTVIGEGGSGGALGIGVGDKLLILEHAYYSVISPEGCAAILWRSGDKAPEAAKALKLTSKDLFELNVIDEIVAEPTGGAHSNPREMGDTLKRILTKHLDKLAETPVDTLLEERYRRIRRIGAYMENSVLKTSSSMA
jgi:acetyl-CoA carboxylase carboxyl transferase subunit alpha